jgi:putative transposase
MRAVHLLRFEHKISKLCQVLRVNRSSYYKHYSSAEAPRTLENRDLKQKILSIYANSKKRFGAQKITQRIYAEYGLKISAGRAYRLMKQMDLPKMSTIKPRRAVHEADSEGKCSNILKQKFDVKEPNRVWVSDITYVKTRHGFAYICAVIDLFSRTLIAWQVSAKIDADLAVNTLKSAFIQRKCPKNVLFHSDRGVQYTAKNFRKIADDLGIIQSFSAKGYPYDNAVAESFFKFLKLEEMGRRSFADVDEVRLAMFEYARFYNDVRPHGFNLGRKPNEKDVEFFNFL